MPKNVVYLFGAGASANALPTVTGFYDRLTAFVSGLHNQPADTALISNEMISDYKWMLQELEGTGPGRRLSADEFAHSLYNSNRSYDLKKLKALISCFFTYEQAVNHFDPRYEEFLNYYLPRSSGGFTDLPSNITFITWNYDTQMERAFYKILTGLPTAANRAAADHVLRQLTYPERTFRLNGVCGTMQNGHYGDEYLLTFGSDKQKAREAVNSMYINYTAGRATPDIRFAFEKDEDNRINFLLSGPIKKAIDAANFIVAIGYSFPAENELIDREMLRSVDNAKVFYLQVHKDDAEDVRDRIEILMQTSSATPQIKTNLNHFFKPIESRP